MTLRVIQWATGGVGRAAIEGIVAHPELELVGCWVHSKDKAGRDVGDICGLPALGVTATCDVDALVNMAADCVLYSPIMADPDTGSPAAGIGKKCGDPAQLVLSRQAGRLLAGTSLQGRQQHTARHRHPSRWYNRAVSADDFSPVQCNHTRACGRVLRHQDLQRPQCGQRYYAVRQNATGNRGQPHGPLSRTGVSAVDGNGRR